MDYVKSLHMAKLMKDRGDEVRDKIIECQKAGRGVVVLRFSENGTKMDIEVADEPLDTNVRVYPGE